MVSGLSFFSGKSKLHKNVKAKLHKNVKAHLENKNEKAYNQTSYEQKSGSFLDE